MLFYIDRYIYISFFYACSPTPPSQMQGQSAPAPSRGGSRKEDEEKEGAADDKGDDEAAADVVDLLPRTDIR